MGRLRWLRPPARQLTLPTPLNSLRVVGNAIYGVQRDELDVEHVVRLKVQ
jgi:hypothetical protein